MKLKNKIALGLGALAVMLSCNVCWASSLTFNNSEPKSKFLYMDKLEQSFYKPNAYHILFQASKNNNKLIIADGEAKATYMVLKPYEDAGVAYDIIELPIKEPNCGLFAVSATAGAHAQNLGFWLLGVIDGKLKVMVDYNKLAKNGFKPDEWNRLYAKFDAYEGRLAISNTTEYMPPWGKISADLINLEKNRWICQWDDRLQDMKLVKTDVERDAFIDEQYKAMIYLEHWLKNNPKYSQLLVGAQLSYSCKNPDGSDGLEVHEIKVIEDHPTHIVTRATFRINEIADIYQYDVASDKLIKIN